MTTGIGTIDLIEMFSEIAAAMQENADVLSRLDTLDGDHGTTMVEAFAQIETRLASVEPTALAPSDIFDVAAEVMLSIDASSARLYAAAFRRAGTAIMRKRQLSDVEFANAFNEMAGGIGAHGTPGGKISNIADVWQTAARAYMLAAREGRVPVECLSAALAAAEGDTETSALLAGSSAFLPDHRLMDAGAVSALLMIRSMRDALR